MKFNYLNTYNKHAIANITIVNRQYIVDGSLPNEIWKPVTFNEVENKCFRKVISVCPFTKKVLKEYNSIAEAAKELQVHKSSIGKAILKNNKCKSRYWYYAT